MYDRAELEPPVSGWTRPPVPAGGRGVSGAVIPLAVVALKPVPNVPKDVVLF
jgi:hypothetical protein